MKQATKLYTIDWQLQMMLTWTYFVKWLIPIIVFSVYSLIPLVKPRNHYLRPKGHI